MERMDWPLETGIEDAPARDEIGNDDEELIEGVEAEDAEGERDR